MARRPLTERQQLLVEAKQALAAERQQLKHQQARVAAARRVVDRLSHCDRCGAMTIPGGEPQLCNACTRWAIEASRKARRQAVVSAASISEALSNLEGIGLES